MKLVTLNIERDAHLDRVLPFLVRASADVVCLQEVFEDDLPLFTERLGMQAIFSPMTRTHRMNGTENDQCEGVAILSRVPFVGHAVEYYYGGIGVVPLHDDADRDSVWQPLLTAVLPTEDRTVTIGTTHFMKSWEGLPDDYQRARMQAFLPFLDRHVSLVLCGDFNIPRGTELYEILAERLRDHVPPEYLNSLDLALHRVPGLSYMIDYVWSTSDRTVRDVSMVCGVSDHCALVAGSVS